MHVKRTNAITEAVILYLVVTATLLLLGVAWGRIRGVYVALIAMSVGELVRSGWLAWRSRARFDLRPVWALCWRAGVALVAMVGVMWLVAQQLTRWGDLWTALVGSLAGGVVYLALSALLSRDQARVLLRAVRRRVVGAE